MKAIHVLVLAGALSGAFLVGCQDNGPKHQTDTEKTVTDSYGSLMNMGVMKLAKRHTFLIDPDGKIRKVYTDVDPAKHSEEVLAALAELQK